MIGCFVLDPGYAVADLGWTAEQYRKGIDTLSKASLIYVDTAESLVRIVDFIKHDPFSNPKHALAAVRMAEKLPDCHEKQMLMADLAQAKHVNPSMLPDTLSIPYRYQEPEPEPEPEQEPEQEDMGKPISPAGKPPVKARMPDGWTLSEEGWAYARSQGIPDEVIEDEARGFQAYWSDRRDRDAAKSERGWEQCWANRCRSISGRYKGRGMAGQAAPNRYGQGGSIASIAARRWAAGQV
jgi:hypothetical protein